MSIKKIFTKYIISTILSLIFTVSSTTFAQGQISPLPEINNLNKFFTRSSSFSGQLGNVTYGPVILDGRPIFFVAVPTAILEEQVENQASPLEQRIERIENNLRVILRRGFDPKTLQVTPAVLNSETVILVSDQKKLNRQTVRTITQADAQLYGQSIEQITPEIVIKIQDALLTAYQERQPENLQRQAIFAVKVFLTIVIFSGFLLSLQKTLKARLIQVKKYLTQLTETKEAVYVLPTNKHLPKWIFIWINLAFDYLTFAPYFYFYFDKTQKIVDSDIPINLINFINNPEYFLTSKELQNLFKKHIKVEILFRRLLLFGQLFIWLQGLIFILFLFPDTRWIGVQLAGTPTSLLFIWLGITIITKITEWLIDWSLTTWTEELSFIEGLSKRQTFRIPTISYAVKGVSTIFFLIIGIVLSLQAFNIPIVPILAGASILGVAISFGAQHIVKDIISGVINLINDSYAVGDRIIIGLDEGLVEDFNLFVTRLRSINGDLLTIPNGLVGIVRNQTKDWSRVDYQIQVSYETDLKKALIVLQEVAEYLYTDPQWQEIILEAPDLKGVEVLSHQGVTLRIWITTAPGQQWLVGREFRLRLKEAFLENGIEIGVPKQTIMMQYSSDKPYE